MSSLIKKSTLIMITILLVMISISAVSASDISADASTAVDDVISVDSQGDSLTSLDNLASNSYDESSGLGQAVEVQSNGKDSDQANVQSGDSHIESDDADVDDSNLETDEVVVNSPNVLAASADDDVLGATQEFHVGTGTGTGWYASLQAALNAVSAGRDTDDYIITIHGNTTYSGNTNVHLTINQAFNSLVIRAAEGDNPVFNGGNNNYVFNIDSQNVRIEGLTFTNTIVNASSTAVTGIQVGPNYGFGNNHGNCVIDNCTFQDMGVWYGAIHVYGSVGNNYVNITNCVFDNNTGVRGGALRSESGANDVNVIGCNFTNNTARNHGGVVCLYSSQTLFEDCLFEDNVGSFSGAIHAHTSGSTINNCTFIHNVADNSVPYDGDRYGTGYGGAVSLLYHDAGGFIINNSHFYNNSAVKYGAAIEINGSGSNAQILNCDFENNSAAYGGAIRINGQNTLVDNCTFKNNTATANGSAHTGYGGAVSINGSNTVIKNSTFIENSAIGNDVDYTGYGGAIEVNGSNTKILDSKFINNSATATESGPEFTGFGGAVSVNGMNTLISNSNFTDNSATQYGGSIDIEGFHTNITDSRIEGSTAHFGGGINCEGDNATISNTVLNNNNATGATGSEDSHGGSIVVYGTNTHITNTTVANSTSINGGGVYIEGNNTVITDSTIYNNNATVNGGGVYIYGDNTTITKSTFELNNAIPDEDAIDDGLGGAIFISTDREATNNTYIGDSNFTHNTARNGSAIYVTPTVEADNCTIIEGCNFTENQAWSYWLPIIIDEKAGTIETNLTGGNNIINAIYNNASFSSICIDGQNPVDGWKKSEGGTIMYQDDREWNQTIQVTVYDREGNIVYGTEEHTTGLGGNVTFDVSGQDFSKWYKVNMTHVEDPNYKWITNLTYVNLYTNISISNHTVNPGDEIVVEVNVTTEDGKPFNGKVNITMNDTAQTNMTVEITNGKGNFTYTVPSEYLNGENITVKGNWSGNFTYVGCNGTGWIKVNPVEFSVNKTLDATKPNYTIGDEVSFNITVTNDGEVTLVNVTVTEVLHDGLVLIEEAHEGWTYKGNEVWVYNNNVTKGQNVTLTLRFTITKSGILNNTVNGTTYNLTNQTSTANVTVDPLKTITIIGPNATFSPGENITINVTLTDENGVGLNGTVKVVMNDTGGFTVNVTINNGKGSFNYTIPSSYTGGENITVNASYAGNETYSPSNGSGWYGVKEVDFTANKTAEDSIYHIGDEVIFNVTIKNTGEADLMNVTVTDVDHPGLEFVEETDYGNWIYLGGATWTYNGNVSVGDTVTLKIKFTVNEIGVLNNTANVTVNNKVNKTPTDNVTAVPWNTTTIIGPNATFSPGENITINVTVEAENGALLNGTVKVVMNDTDGFTVDVTINNGKGSFNYTVPLSYTGGENITVNASYAGNETYSPSNGSGWYGVKEVDFTANKTAEDSIYHVGDEVIFNVTIKNTGDADLMNVTVTDVDHPGLDLVEETDYGDWIYLGDATWTYDGNVSVDQTVTLKIKFTVNMAGVLNNTANVTVNHVVNETPTDNITVEKIPTVITVTNTTVYPGDIAVVNITLEDEDGNPLNGTIHVSISIPSGNEGYHKLTAREDTFDLDVQNGQASFEYQVPKDADPETLDVVAAYDGNEKYEASSGDGWIKVIEKPKKPTTTTVSNVTTRPGTTVDINVTVVDDEGNPVNGTVELTLPDGKKVLVEVKDGKGTYKYSVPQDAPNGTTYEVPAVFLGNDDYEGSNGTGFINVIDDSVPEEPEEPVNKTDVPNDVTVLPATGNPLFALLLVLIALGVSIRRRD